MLPRHTYSPYYCQHAPDCGPSTFHQVASDTILSPLMRFLQVYRQQVVFVV